MTATSYTNSTGAIAGASFGGWLGRFFQKLMAAQEATARKRVQSWLRWQRDDVLKGAGYSATDIANIRKGRFVAHPGS